MKIGVFDSGFGGLSILRHIREALPDYDYVYLGDNARAPYGPRTREEVIAFTTQAVDFLFKQDCQLIILACNTASAMALRHIQQVYLPAHYPERRILGVLIPAAEAAVAASTHGRVGVMATQGTVESGSFESEIQKLKTDTIVVQEACPALVPLIEQGSHNSEDIVTALKGYLQPLIEAGVESIILGCTHYELIRPLIREVVPSPIHLVVEGVEVAERLSDYLRRHPETERLLSLGGSLVAFTTGNVEQFERLGSGFYGHPLSAQLLSVF